MNATRYNTLTGKSDRVNVLKVLKNSIEVSTKEIYPNAQRSSFKAYLKPSRQKDCYYEDEFSFIVLDK